jgi:hypothetical protein
MFKIFTFLKYAALIVIFGILAVFSSLSFSDDKLKKESLENNGFWQSIKQVIRVVTTVASSLGRVNLEKKIPLGSNINIKNVSENFPKDLKLEDYDLANNLSDGNRAWADFFAKIKEEWANTKLD